MKIYGVMETGVFIDKLIDKYGYEIAQMREGVLGWGDLVLIAPDEKHYNFVIKEIYINEWNSGQTIRRAKKISKTLQQRIDGAAAEQMGEEI